MTSSGVRLILFVWSRGWNEQVRRNFVTTPSLLMQEGIFWFQYWR